MDALFSCRQLSADASYDEWLMEPSRHNNLRIVYLLWAPWKLPSVAARSSMLLAFVLGSVALAMCGAFVFSVSLVAGSEPFPSMANYMRAFLTFAFGCGGVLALPVLAFSFFIYPIWSDGSVRDRASARLCMLWPVCLVIPVLLWSVVFAIAQIQTPSFGLNSGKPAWVGGWVVGMLSSPGVAMLIVFAGFGLLAYGYQTLDRHLPSETACAKCGYDLTGLPHARCPECGNAKDNPAPRGTELNGSDPADG